MPRFVEFYNPSSLPARSVLGGLLRSALSRDYAIIPVAGMDDVGGRRERSARGGPAEVEIYADGSGFEIAWRGRVFMLGVERVEPPEPRGIFAALRCFASFILAGH